MASKLRIAMRKSIPALALVLTALASAARADTVQLPYQTGDNNGNQWIVYYQGQLQQQGNQPIFSQAGMITINGQQPNQNTQQATLDDKTHELILNLGRNDKRCQRRIKFDEETGIVRIIDIFENTSGSDQQYNISLMTNTNFGVTNAQVLEDARKKTQIGWAADTGASRAAMSLWAGKGAKVTPTVRYNQGNNQATAVLNFKVPNKDKVAIVHWHGSFDTADAANTWVQQMRETKLLADVPTELRKIIVNIGANAGGSIGGREVLRGDVNDIVELRNGDQMRGDLKIDKFDIVTDFGPLSLDAKKVVCVLNVGETRPRQLIVTSDGEIFGGELSSKTIPLLLSSGQTTQVPLSQIARVGYRTGGTEPPEWSLNQPMIFLRSGERCLIAPPTEPIEFVTRYGPLSLKPDRVAAVVLKNGGNAHDVYLVDGSKLSGLLTRPQWGMKLTSASGDAKVQFPLAAVARVLLKPLPDDVGAGVSTLSLLGGDIVATRIEGSLKLNTPFDVLDINASEVRSLVRSDEDSSELVVTLFDQSVFRGTLVAPSLSVKIGGDIPVEVPTAALREYQNPQPFPSQSIVQKTKEQVALLNAEDWKQREAAEAALVNLGPTIVGVLQSSTGDQPPEVQQRLQSVLKRLKRDTPTAASRLSPLPPLE